MPCTEWAPNECGINEGTQGITVDPPEIGDLQNGASYSRQGPSFTSKDTEACSQTGDRRPSPVAPLAD